MSSGKHCHQSGCRGEDGEDAHCAGSAATDLDTAELECLNPAGCGTANVIDGAGCLVADSQAGGARAGGVLRHL